MKKIELLSPAKDFVTGIAAIDYGADAVYIGAYKFGARAAAGNDLKEIESLINYAHKFYAKVYVTINTIIYDFEFEEAQKLINKLYEIGTDAIIIQDMAIFEMELPPLPIIASTQANNYSLEKIKFFENIGIKRVILARELSLEQIKNIKNNTSIELESFVHGSLCVSLSGQCYLSEYICGRSANRGECSQPCRSSYNLVDASGTILLKNKNILSLKDLNLSLHLNDLINVGISSFKIEGRLKDIYYVKNITAFYRKILDEIILDNNNLSKTSSGKVYFDFIPNPNKTFNRGYSNYFLYGAQRKLSSFYTAKSIGEYLGKVSDSTTKYFEIETNKDISNGDGICFCNSSGDFKGTYINNTNAKKIIPNKMEKIPKGTKIFRNFDKKFLNELEKSKTVRKISAKIRFEDNNNGIAIYACDEDDNKISLYAEVENIPAQKKENIIDLIEKQTKKTGDSIFEISSIEININKVKFIPISKLNEIRRTALLLLEKERLQNYKRENCYLRKDNTPFPQTFLDYTGNVVNLKAKEFYLRHQVKKIEPGFEITTNRKNKILMTTKYCIKRELEMCPFENKKVKEIQEPLYLINNKNKFMLKFDCKNCFMKVISL